MITGVFKSSLAVTFGDVLINIHIRPEAIHPLGILLSEGELPEIPHKTPVYFEFPELRLGNMRLKLCFDPALVAEVSNDSVLPNEDKESHTTILHDSSNRIEKMIKSLGRYSEVGDAYLFDRETRFSNSVAGVIRLLRLGSLNLHDFIPDFGGGEGLTPAFDDFCTGLLLTDVLIASTDHAYATESLTGSTPSASRLVQTNDGFFTALHTRTTLPAYWQLRFASSGTSSLLIERFMKKLLYSRIAASDILRLISIGHTSGTDILCGIHARLNAFSRINAV
ncbi:MAG: DUF2877 domain-containing protein [Candidatus Riflebacteria bacterium]|nr:DUF2877 domain-containing protein [Candidatus Riflebacteria bacterium]